MDMAMVMDMDMDMAMSDMEDMDTMDTMARDLLMLSQAMVMGMAMDMAMDMEDMAMEDMDMVMGTMDKRERNIQFFFYSSTPRVQLPDTRSNKLCCFLINLN